MISQPPRGSDLRLFIATSSRPPVESMVAAGSGDMVGTVVVVGIVVGMQALVGFVASLAGIFQ